VAAFQRFVAEAGPQCLSGTAETRLQDIAVTATDQRGRSGATH
jgi:hypothetical protein